MWWPELSFQHSYVEMGGGDLVLGVGGYTGEALRPAVASKKELACKTNQEVKTNTQSCPLTSTNVKHSHMGELYTHIHR